MKSDYIPAPIDVSDIQLPSELCELAEIIAKNVHEVWAAGRLAEGWKYGPERNDMLRTHPGLVPYEELSETEKDYDRRTAMETLKSKRFSLRHRFFYILWLGYLQIVRYPVSWR